MKPPIATDIVIIEWHDAVNESTRTDEGELAKVKLAINRNVGWVVHENDVRIVLAHGWSTSGEVDHFTIPKGDIIRREALPATREE